MLVLPKDERYYVAFKISFLCTNNTTEYEDLIQELEWAQKHGIKCLKVHGDIELIVNQVRSLNAIKNDVLKSYRDKVWDLLEDFDAINIFTILRSKNQHADRLAAMGAQYDIIDSIKAQFDQQHIKIFTKLSVLGNNVSCQVFENDE